MSTNGNGNGHGRETKPSVILELTMRKCKALAKGKMVQVLQDGKLFQIEPFKVPAVLKRFSRKELEVYLKQLD